jgi:hypothetical protein
MSATTMQQLRDAIEHQERETAVRREAADREWRRKWEATTADHFAEFCAKRLCREVSLDEARQLLAAGLDPLVSERFRAWRVAFKAMTLR